MDGMLLVTFFFPVLVTVNITLSVITFLLSLIVSFGPEIVQILVDMLKSNPNTSDYASLVTDLLGEIPSVEDSKKPLSVFWSIFVSGVTVWTTLSTYGVGGAARHGKKGWRFVQPGVGGVRFILVQVMTWVTMAASIAMPWTTLKDFGWLTVLGVVADKEKDPASHRGLLVVGSALGMLANTFVVLGLMSFDPKEKMIENLNRKRRNFEVGKWKWNLFGDSEAWWWLFLILQGTFVVFSWQLAVMIEMSSTVKNNIVESLLLMVVTSLLAVPLALTNAVAGKWRHGERNYRLSMPCQGGPIFVVLQGFGWALFASAFVVTLAKLYSTATASNTKVSISSTASLGFVSYLCIVASLFYFDPAQVKKEDNDLGAESEGEDDTIQDDSFAASTPSQQKRAHSVLGRRQSPSVKGALEYLVQWKPTSSPGWILEELLLKEDPDAIRMNERVVRTPRMHGTSSSTSSNGTRGRSISPKLNPARVDPTEHQENDDEEDEDADESSDEDNVDINTDSDSEDVWEEVEDENGNVFYFNEKKNLAVNTLPKHIEELLTQKSSTAVAH
jgi:hypothetical protein